MRQLIVLRHGKAESVSASGGDFARGLTHRGRRDSALIGRLLADLGVPHLALLSPARRTLETWEAAAPAFPDVQADYVQRLYHASCETIAEVVEAHAETFDVIMVVGHNPGLHEFVVSLMTEKDRRTDAGAQLLESFPTAAAAVFQVSERTCALQRLLLPREHGGGA